MPRLLLGLKTRQILHFASFFIHCALFVPFKLSEEVSSSCVACLPSFFLSFLSSVKLWCVATYLFVVGCALFNLRPSDVLTSLLSMFGVSLQPWLTTFLGALKPLLPSGPLGALMVTTFRPPSSRFMHFSFDMSRSGRLEELEISSGQQIQKIRKFCGRHTWKPPYDEIHRVSDIRSTVLSC